MIGATSNATAPREMDARPHVTPPEFVVDPFDAPRSESCIDSHQSETSIEQEVSKNSPDLDVELQVVVVRVLVTDPTFRSPFVSFRTTIRVGVAGDQPPAHRPPSSVSSMNAFASFRPAPVAWR